MAPERVERLSPEGLGSARAPGGADRRLPRAEAESVGFAAIDAGGLTTGAVTVGAAIERRVAELLAAGEPTGASGRPRLQAAPGDPRPPPASARWWRRGSARRCRARPTRGAPAVHLAAVGHPAGVQVARGDVDEGVAAVDCRRLRDVGVATVAPRSNVDAAARVPARAGPGRSRLRQAGGRASDERDRLQYRYRALRCAVGPSGGGKHALVGRQAGRALRLRDVSRAPDRPAPRDARAARRAAGCACGSARCAAGPPGRAAPPWSGPRGSCAGT